MGDLETITSRFTDKKWVSARRRGPGGKCWVAPFAPHHSHQHHSHHRHHSPAPKTKRAGFRQLFFLQLLSMQGVQGKYLQSWMPRIGRRDHRRFHRGFRHRIHHHVVEDDHRRQNALVHQLHHDLLLVVLRLQRVHVRGDPCH